MAWGKRTSPPDVKGGVPKVMLVCNECWVLAHSNEYMDGTEAAQLSVLIGDGTAPDGHEQCEGCHRLFKPGSLWDLSSNRWFKLEVQLAVKEGSTK